MNEEQKLINKVKAFALAVALTVTALPGNDCWDVSNTDVDKDIDVWEMNLTERDNLGYSRAWDVAVGGTVTQDRCIPVVDDDGVKSTWIIDKAPFWDRCPFCVGLSTSGELEWLPLEFPWDPPPVLDNLGEDLLFLFRDF